MPDQCDKYNQAVTKFDQSKNAFNRFNRKLSVKWSAPFEDQNVRGCGPSQSPVSDCVLRDKTVGRYNTPSFVLQRTLRRQTGHLIFVPSCTYAGYQEQTRIQSLVSSCQEILSRRNLEALP